MIWRPTGHEIDVAGDAARVAERPLKFWYPGAVGEGIPDALDRRELADEVLDQERSEACVWFAVAMALYLCGQARRDWGDGIPMPSPMQMWILSQWEKLRELGVDPSSRVATNVGSSLSSGLRALETFGIVSAKAWPMDQRLSWTAPEPTEPLIFDMPIDIDDRAAVAKLGQDYGANGADFPTLARAALVLDHFPVQAFDVCDQFFELGPGHDLYRGTEGRPIRGRHMMCCVGYGPGYLLYRGSYGRGWGDDGHVRVANDYSASPQARDGAVLTYAPRIAA